mmetsp:Transcript_144294/g.262425  ORF Transcript_144294/g.262425 Transcript_144294/m.262425 type:complete len:591 (-) Transcript_144294:28-1800(-)
MAQEAQELFKTHVKFLTSGADPMTPRFLLLSCKLLMELPRQHWASRQGEAENQCDATPLQGSDHPKMMASLHVHKFDDDSSGTDASQKLEASLVSDSPSVPVTTLDLSGASESRAVQKGVLVSPTADDTSAESLPAKGFDDVLEAATASKTWNHVHRAGNKQRVPKRQAGLLTQLAESTGSLLDTTNTGATAAGASATRTCPEIQIKEAEVIEDASKDSWFKTEKGMYLLGDELKNKGSKYFEGEERSWALQQKVFQGTRKQVESDTEIAIKRIPSSSPEQEVAITQEFRFQQCVRSEKVVQAYDAFKSGKDLYVVLELLGTRWDSGVDTLDSVEYEDPENWFLGPDKVFIPVVDFFEKAAADLLTGLQAMHEQQIIHNDLTLQNTVITNGVPVSAKWLGFGYATEGQQAESQLQQDTRSHSSQQTYPFIAPERMTNKIGYKSDVWSLGAVCCYLLGLSPPSGKTQYHYEQIANQDGAHKSLRDAGYARWVVQMLTNEYKDRPSLDLVAKRFKCLKQNREDPEYKKLEDLEIARTKDIRNTAGGLNPWIEGTKQKFLEVYGEKDVDAKWQAAKGGGDEYEAAVERCLHLE